MKFKAKLPHHNLWEKHLSVGYFVWDELPYMAFLEPVG